MRSAPHQNRQGMSLLCLFSMHSTCSQPSHGVPSSPGALRTAAFTFGPSTFTDGMMLNGMAHHP